MIPKTITKAFTPHVIVDANCLKEPTFWKKLVLNFIQTKNPTKMHFFT